MLCYVSSDVSSRPSPRSSRCDSPLQHSRRSAAKASVPAAPKSPALHPLCTRFTRYARASPAVQGPTGGDIDMGPGHASLSFQDMKNAQVGCADHALCGTAQQ